MLPMPTNFYLITSAATNNEENKFTSTTSCSSSNVESCIDTSKIYLCNADFFVQNGQCVPACTGATVPDFFNYCRSQHYNNGFYTIQAVVGFRIPDTPLDVTWEIQFLLEPSTILITGAFYTSVTIKNYNRVVPV